MDRETRLLYFSFFNEIGIIHQLSRALFEARLPRGVTVPHFSVLNHLIRVGDGPTPLKLANAFQVPKTTMTHTLSGLVERGWIEMRPNPEDGRSKRVFLTDAGRTFRDEAIALLDPDVDWMSRHIPRDRLQDMVPRLSEVRRLLDDRRDAD
jgi:DNA-binding MarR family transcriptional regulator